MTTPPAPQYGSASAPAKTNTLAIVGLILAFVFNIAGLIVSIIALNQIKRTGENGRGLALAGLIISIVSIVFGVIWIIFVVSVALADPSLTTGY
jgi:hypothetical protein